MDIQYLKGIGATRARLFQRLGLFSVEDLLSFYPRAYEDRTAVRPIAELLPGESACVEAVVGAPVTHARIRQGLELWKTAVYDGSATLQLTFFNAPYVRGALIPGETFVFYGKLGANPLRPEMTNPIFEPAGKPGQATRRVVPVYASTAGLTQGLLRSAVRQALDKTAEQTDDILPPPLRECYGLCHSRFARENIHFPRSPEELGLARRRLVFEELLLLQLGLLGLRDERGRLPGPVLPEGTEEEFWSAMPFAPTEGQAAAVRDIFEDCRGGAGMNRLIQGDVGSGKTAVAAAAAWLAMKNGCQAALMAPTEILAEQHARTLTPLFQSMGFRPALLTGRGTAQNRAVRAGLGDGSIDFVVGTHALLSENTRFARLGMVVADEQHRFGVAQRAALSDKGTQPHRLLMSATPIPRTLAQILYGDLDVSPIRGLPPGRSPVKTYVVGEDYRPRIEAFIRKLAGQGRQVYVVCPLIVDEEGLELSAAEDEAARLGKVFPDLRVGLLHGRMGSRAKERVMIGFADGDLDILVATTVVEVGVNVPNATLMIVENAERFGLSQLHQLRGRVGRGAHESHCVLFLQSGAAAARERLDALRRTNDGFAVAEADLRLRGPGDFFGDRQHGLPVFRIASLETDLRVLKDSREAALALRADDPALALPENGALRAAVDGVLLRARQG